MPGATGLEVLQQLDYEPKVIFTTAHDQYAVTAFELGALDYLLKPFGRDRLERVLRRAQAAWDGAAAPLLSRARESLEPACPLSRIFVRDGNRIVPIPLASLERAQGADDYVTISTITKQYLVSIRLSDLEERLRAANFLRVHRSHLINLDYVTSIEPHDLARLQVVMKSGARIVASRAGSKRLRDLAL
jgi:two-component system LytT family response regulator